MFVHASMCSDKIERPLRVSKPDSIILHASSRSFN